MIYSDITPELIFDFRNQRLLHWDPRLLEEDSDCGDYDDGDWDSTNDTDEDRNDDRDDDRDDDAADDYLLTLKKTIVSTSSTLYIIDAIQSIKLLRKKILYVEHNKYNLLKQFL